MKAKRIIVTGGGTSGHIYPILEVVSLLKKRHPIEVLFIGGKDNIEATLVKDIPFKGISVGKLRRSMTLLHFRDSLRVARGVVSAKKIVSEFKPDLFFAKGGYVSLPIVAIALQTKIPLVTHESDSVLGLSNRIAAKVAKKICVAFPVRYYPKALRDKLVYTGTPVRGGFFNRPTIKDRQLFMLKKDLPVILVTGGSQGAKALNDTVEKILPILLRRAQVIHLTGSIWESHFIGVKKSLPATTKNNYHPFGYLKKGMEEVVRVSDLAIARSGSTISELSAAGIPMILIPLPTAANNHQVKNAEVYTKEGAAVAIRQQHLTPERLLRTINTLLDDSVRRKAMSSNSKKMSKPDAVDNVVRTIEDILYSKYPHE